MGIDSFFDYPDSPEPSSFDQEPFLSTCSDDEWRIIREYTDAQRFDAGHRVVSQGNVDRSLLVVIRGQLEVVITKRRGGRRRRIALLDVGSVIGELGFLDGKPASADVWSLTEVEVLRLPLNRFEILAARDPQLGLYVVFDLGRILAERLRGLQEQSGT